MSNPNNNDNDDNGDDDDLRAQKALILGLTRQEGEKEEGSVAEVVCVAKDANDNNQQDNTVHQTRSMIGHDSRQETKRTTKTLSSTPTRQQQRQEQEQQQQQQEQQKPRPPLPSCEPPTPPPTRDASSTMRQRQLSDSMARLKHLPLTSDVTATINATTSRHATNDNATYKDGWIPGRTTTSRAVVAVAGAVGTNRTAIQVSNAPSPTSAIPPPPSPPPPPPSRHPQRSVVFAQVHEVAVLSDDKTEPAALQRVDSKTPTVHAVPVAHNTSVVTSPQPDNDNNNNNDDDDEGQANEAMIQQLLQQDEEEVLAVVAVPANVMEEEEIRLLRNAVRELHTQLQNQDEQVRQLRHQLESLSTTSSSSTTLTKGTASSQAPLERETPHRTVWKKYRCTIVTVSAFVVLAIIIVGVMVGVSTVSADADSSDRTTWGTVAPTQSPTLIPTDGSTIVPSNKTAAPSEVTETQSPTLIPTIPSSTLAPSYLRPTSAPTGDEEPMGASNVAGSNIGIIIIIITIMAVAIVVCGSLLYYFVRRRRRRSNASDLAVAAPPTPTTTGACPVASAAAAAAQTPAAPTKEQRERLEAEVTLALHALLSNRDETARRLQAILSKKHGIRTPKEGM